MYGGEDDASGRDAKITERSEKARREFFDKCEKIKKGAHYNDKLIIEIANKGAQEYNKVFGRIGVHPLLHLKGGKKRPRYLVERDELWVMYKPPLWSMGGVGDTWRKNLDLVKANTHNLKQAEELFLASEKAETLQEWHGLLNGLLWVPPEHVGGDMKGWGFIQRLDLETDGPVIVAKTWRAMRMMQVQMKEHVNTKAYVALVHGRVENRVQHIKRKFAELGNDAATQVMLQHDGINDPFFDWSMDGRWPSRSVRMAETFFKPLAYFHRKEDNSDYTLIYVNILTGITHQIRITMQSCGHPLVSDDRYLPRDQALSDLKWCPRNFLVAVRSDFFDLTGTHEDPARRNYTRISLENPLPKVFQNIIKQKLVLTERLDPTADLCVGPSYWAIGDEELMASYPKDDEFRKKVMRWGLRRGIHTDAMDRLLLLSKEDIDEILNNYKPPSQMYEEMYKTWVCPACMHWNSAEASAKFGEDPDKCKGGSKIGALGRECEGRRLVDPDFKPADGYMNWAKDPTIHFLYIVNHRWLDARRAVFKSNRATWERPPDEPEGTVVTPQIMAALKALLEQKAKVGETGIHEFKLKSYAGLEDISVPLSGFSSDDPVQRTRLPGKGSHSQYFYTLKADLRIKWSAEFDAVRKRYTAPLYVKTDALSEAQIKKPEDVAEGSPDGLHRSASGSFDLPPDKRARFEKWTKVESKSNPGKFYYVNNKTKETSIERPDDFFDPEEKEPTWERRLSKTTGSFYFFNKETGESQSERPENVEVKVDTKAEEKILEELNKWERKESKSKPGQFYYFNHRTGENEVKPPTVDYPWKLCESKSQKGQYFYHNEVTGVTSVDPPPTAKKIVKKAEPETKETPTEKLAAGWVKKESDKYPGKFYYSNPTTNETSWKKPSPWERIQSNSKPGVYYYKNVESGDTSWEKQIVGVVP